MFKICSICCSLHTKMLLNFVISILQHRLCSRRLCSILEAVSGFQLAEHDGTPPHIHSYVITFLNVQLFEPWFGWVCCTSWSPWRQYLTCLQFSCGALSKIIFTKPGLPSINACIPENLEATNMNSDRNGVTSQSTGQNGPGVWEDSCRSH